MYLRDYFPLRAEGSRSAARLAGSFNNVGAVISPSNDKPCDVPHSLPNSRRSRKGGRRRFIRDALRVTSSTPSRRRRSVGRLRKSRRRSSCDLFHTTPQSEIPGRASLGSTASPRVVSEQRGKVATTARPFRREAIHLLGGAHHMNPFVANFVAHSSPIGKPNLRIAKQPVPIAHKNFFRYFRSRLQGRTRRIFPLMDRAPQNVCYVIRQSQANGHAGSPDPWQRLPHTCPLTFCAPSPIP